MDRDTTPCLNEEKAPYGEKSGSEARLRTLQRMLAQADGSRAQMREAGLTVFAVNSKDFWRGLKNPAVS